jgi:hypothetical protein
VLDPASGALDCAGGAVDVSSVGQSKSKVLDSATATDVLCPFFEHEYVARPRRLRLQEILFAVDREHPEHIVIELKRSLQIAHGEREVGQAERFDHRSLPGLGVDQYLRREDERFKQTPAANPVLMNRRSHGHRALILQELEC